MEEKLKEVDVAELYDNKGEDSQEVHECIRGRLKSMWAVKVLADLLDELEEKHEVRESGWLL